ncbi:MAG: Cytochrome c oxidase assembly protein cox15 [Pleopsidium flavum]|nr:MAG: Cytochrome c oxidase assembly protein cox15 [Pleopsidium flavum]
MASIFHSLPALRRAAPRLTREFFVCRRCLQKPPSSPSLAQRSKGTSPFLQAFRSNSTYSTQLNRTTAETIWKSSTPLASLSKSISDNSRAARASFFPETSDKVVAYWLLGSAASVFGIVVFGGLTRLTESGLSITEWKPVTGSLPPSNAGDWESEFTKYQSSPEFKLLNPNMTLSEFKSIYYMEWGHRLWGRFVGLSFLLPAVYFIARRRVSGRMAAKLVGISGLIGFQGVLGWWMVKSGLKDDLFAPGSHPRVSQYRLTAHLGTAFLCFTAMLWNGLSILRAHRLLADPVAGDKALSILRDPSLKIFRRSVAGLAVLVFCTAMSGGLVAGLDAGLIYNEFPHMGLGLTPPKSELFSDFYSHRADNSDIWWRNPLENPSLVQLDHRILATTTFSSVMALWAYTRFSPTVRKILPATAKRGMHGVVGFVCLQVALGISTLIYLVPLPLASAHQAGSLALLTWVVVLGSRIWVPRRASRLLAQHLQTVGPASARNTRPGNPTLRTTNRSMGSVGIPDTMGTSRLGPLENHTPHAAT